MHGKDHVELEVAFTRRVQSSPVVMMWVGIASEVGRMPNRVKIPPHDTASGAGMAGARARPDLPLHTPNKRTGIMPAISDERGSGGGCQYHHQSVRVNGLSSPYICSFDNTFESLTKPWLAGRRTLFNTKLRGDKVFSLHIREL